MKLEASMKHERVTVRHGYWFYFNDGGVKITAFGSGYSGKEIIYVGDEEVSSKRAMRIRSSHKFAHGGHHYGVEFVLVNFWTGELECVLSKDGAEIERATKAYFVKEEGGMGRKLGIAVAQGALIGALITFLMAKFLWK
jgi:hypothetical protein